MASSPIPVIPPVAVASSDLPQSGWGYWLVQIARTLNLVLGGKINATTTLTLAAGTTTTTMTDSRIGVYSVIYLMPTTANAAAALAGLYIAPGVGSAVVTHANTATTDRTFGVLIIG